MAETDKTVWLHQLMILQNRIDVTNIFKKQWYTNSQIKRHAYQKT